jgi:hypothetical protein
MGDGRRHGHLGSRRRERRPHQPGGDPGLRRAAQVLLGEGPALLVRPGVRRVRRRRACVAGLRQRDQPVQLRREDTQERRPGARDFLDLRHVPRGVLPRRLRRAADRPNRGHGLPADLRRRDHRPQEHRRRLQHGAAHYRLCRGGGRHVLRPERGLRDQPGPRLRAPTARLLRRLGAGGPTGHLPCGPWAQFHRLLLDTDRGAAHRRRHRRPPVRPVHRRRAARPAEEDRGSRRADPGEPAGGSAGNGRTDRR